MTDAQHGPRLDPGLHERVRTRAADGAYAPYRGSSVGAALLTAGFPDDRTGTAVAVGLDAPPNIACGASWHLLHACGRHRVVAGEDGAVRTYAFAGLPPHSFGFEDLHR